jgi:hypothetical protein
MPENLTSDQALEIAKKLLKSAGDLKQFRQERRASISQEEFIELFKNESALRMQSQDFAACSISCTVAELDGAITQLSGGIAELKRTAANLESVRKMIGMASTMVSLGAAVASGNPNGIAQALLAITTVFPRPGGAETRA